MKRTLLKYLLSLFFVTTIASAETNKTQIGAGISYQTVKDFDDGGSAFVLNFKRYFEKLFFQAELTSTLGSPEKTLYSTTNTSVGTASFYSTNLGLYGGYQHPIAENSFAHIRLGGLYSASEVESCIIGVCDAEEESKMHFSFGFGAGFWITKNYAIELAWTKLGPDLSHLGVTVVRNF